jgi:glycine betaine/proline transport system substrate-binding protein
MFGKWNLKFLDDPEKVYGEPEAIHTMANKQFVQDSPDMAAFFDTFDWPQLELQEVMVDIQEGTTPEAAARAFVDAHQTEIDALLPDATDYQ